MSDGTAEPQPGIPGPPPEAVLLRLVRKASGASLQQAARAVGISKAWLSSIETGHDSRTRYGDGTRPVRASDEIIARLALFLRVSPERLETEGQRPDAAAVLREIHRQQDPLTPDERQTLSGFREAAGPRPDDDDPLSPEDHKALDDYRTFILSRAAERRRQEAEEKQANGGKSA